MAAEYDITIDQGATFNLMITINDDGGTPINLTGYTFRGSVRETVSGDVQASFDFTIQTQSGGTLGQVLAYITATNTAAITVPEDRTPGHRRVRKMLYDIESVNGSEVTRWLQGVASISPEVTR